ncbi:acyl-CoA dehydrogenase (plasmid) [Rhodococcus sp. BH4]|uniref:acyl-CoA dehydrogenase family protein n=1 Tax=Rhodococcus sp. BH4 TaxID=1807790 RepID=UPI0009C38CFB|nr:acyl-CoA dehydrogenase family protein [Rhodococcus sp. BH4]ARE37818.1 acyl-CoA dehydrogenase [Rhodococcus sp. BH4]
MDFALSAEQDELAASERAWLTKHDPIASRRKSIDDGPVAIDPATVSHAIESGLLGLMTEDMGGTHVDLAVLVEEHGRAGSALPLAELALAAAELEKLDHPLSAKAVDAASGEDIIAIATASNDGVPFRVDINGSTLNLAGSSAPSVGLFDATGYLVAGQDADGREIAALLTPGQTSVAVRNLETLDLTRTWSTLEFDVTLSAEHWTLVPEGTLSRISDALALYRKMDALGAAQKLLDLSVEYATQRTQFDRPIGSFQAVKHHLANMALMVEASRASLWAGAVALDEGSRERRSAAVSAAAAYAGESTSTVAQTALQVHGGIGFTWEHDLHLLIRRIKVDELLNGSVSWHRRRLISA